jgi:hypothetical protein
MAEKGVVEHVIAVMGGGDQMREGEGGVEWNGMETVASWWAG